MLAYGYAHASNAEQPTALSEATLLCTKDELDQIISFLQNIQQKCQSDGSVSVFHSHYRDFCKQWNPSDSDFIICLREDAT